MVDGWIRSGEVRRWFNRFLYIVECKVSKGWTKIWGWDFPTLDSRVASDPPTPFKKKKTRGKSPRRSTKKIDFVGENPIYITSATALIPKKIEIFLSISSTLGTNYRIFTKSHFFTKKSK